MTGIDLQKVQTANAVYRNLCTFLEMLMSTTIVTIENPRRSHFWNLKCVKRLIRKLQLKPIEFQQCMHGGMRDKWTMFMTNRPDCFAELAKTCDQAHDHLPWGIYFAEDSWKFQTAEEAAYPQLLCDRIANIVRIDLERRGVCFVNPKPSKKKSMLSKTRAAQAGKQPRGNLLPHLIPEFKQIVQLDVPVTMDLRGTIPVALARQYNLPSSSKFLPPNWGKCGAKTSANNQVDEPDVDVLPPKIDVIPSKVDVESKTAMVGIFRTPEEFEDEAMRLHHLFDSDTTVDDDNKRAVFLLFTKGPEWVKENRSKVLEHYRRLNRWNLARGRYMMH